MFDAKVGRNRVHVMESSVHPSVFSPIKLSFIRNIASPAEFKIRTFPHAKAQDRNGSTPNVGD